MRSLLRIGVGLATLLTGCFEGRFMLHQACRSDVECVDLGCRDGFCGGPPPDASTTDASTGPGSSTGPGDGCGDGELDPGEACDGPVDDPGMRCVACALATCPQGLHLVPEDFCAASALPPAQCLLLCVPDTCGDGLLSSSYETCDDGNSDNDDACLATCEAATCGDGFVHPGSELCDDGNNNNDDACDQRCTTPSCGDGVVQAPEECDDGNTQDADACRNVCVAARCGDGVVELGVEDCDYGDSDDDNCAPGCKAAMCGDGFVQADSEACDDGNPDDSDMCVAGCQAAICGDGFTQAGVEGCDGGPDHEDPECGTDCVLTSCGDGLKQTGEECDDNNADNTDDCLDTCFAASCGDGYQFPDKEACDAGWFNAAVGCVDGCKALTPITAIAAGPFTTCALIEGGALRCWGRNAQCQLGLGNLAAVGDDEYPGEAPALDLGEHKAVQVVLGRDHSCALFDDASVRCWGAGYAGLLGYADNVYRGCEPATTPGLLSPVEIWANDEFTVQLAAGEFHTCALSSEGRVRCWGTNIWGDLGYPEIDTVGEAEPPIALGPVEIGGEATALFAHHHTTCVVLAGTGALRCWGANFWGSLGLGHYEQIGDDEEPASADDIPLPAPVATLGLGNTHTCALLDNDATYCWGANFDGELGLSDPFLVAATPQELEAGLEIAELALGAALTCARLTDGAVRCWGTGAAGQRASGTVDSSGAGTPASAADPVAFDDPSPAAQMLAAGNGHVCAKLVDGTLRCWGAGTDGQTGHAQTVNLGDDPDELPLSTPVFVFPF